MTEDKRKHIIEWLKNEVQKFKNRYRKRFAWAISLKRNKHIVDMLDEIFPQLKEGNYSIQTKLYWLLNDLQDFPKCVVCDNPIYSQVGTTWHMPTHCSKLCAMSDYATIEKIRQTNIRLYGVPCTFQTEKSWNAIHKAVIDKYGGTTGNIWETEYGIQRCKETKLKKNNGQYESEETKQLRKNTIIDKYGGTTGNIFGTEHGIEQIKKTNLQNYGVEYILSLPQYHTPEIIANNLPKINATKKRNGTFNTSKPEEDAYKYLCQKFKQDDIIRQYNSELYPFNCDFYIKSFDLYIECNFNWTHGGHWYDPLNENDQNTLKKWQDKGTDFYKNAINTWTVRDVNKHQIAIDNNLNYLVFWKLSELESWLSSFTINHDNEQNINESK